MKRNLMAGTDLEVSEITFGAGTAAGLMVSGSAFDQDSTVARAFELGVNCFDTAYVYGFGCSEVNLGRSLELIGEPHVLTTKVSLSRNDLTSGDIESSFRTSFDQSLIRLRREQLDVLLLHNAIHRYRTMDTPHQAYLSLDDVLSEHGVLSAVDKLRDQGKIRHFGINGMMGDVVTLRALIASGKVSVIVLPLNLMNPSGSHAHHELSHDLTQQSNYLDYEGVVEFARANDVGVMTVSPVAAGVLTDRAHRGESAPVYSNRAIRFEEFGQFERELAAADRFSSVAKQFDMTLTELAYRFVLSQRGVGTIIGGFSDASQLEEAVWSVEAGVLNSTVLAAIEHAWSPRKDEFLKNA
jgi:aryl-alcohol dehydrogenase-like predicted oxidoreductase